MGQKGEPGTRPMHSCSGGAIQNPARRSCRGPGRNPENSTRRPRQEARNANRSPRGGSIPVRMRNLPVAIVVAAIVGTFPVIEALAQPPAIAHRAGAVVVTSVPFSYAEDTSEATDWPEALLEQWFSLLQAAIPLVTKTCRSTRSKSRIRHRARGFREHRGSDQRGEADDDAVGLTFGRAVPRGRGDHLRLHGGVLLRQWPEWKRRDLAFSIFRRPPRRRSSSRRASAPAAQLVRMASPRIPWSGRVLSRGVVFISGTVRQRRGYLFVARGPFFTQVACNSG